MQTNDHERILALYHGCCAGDVPAYQELGRYLLQVARYQLAKSYPQLLDEAEDCVQDALTDIWRALQAGRGPSKPTSFRTWCTTIINRRVVDRQRKHGRSFATVSLDQEVNHADGSGATLGENIVDEKASDPGKIIPEARTLEEVLLKIYNYPALTDNERAVIWDGYINGVTTAELAKRLDRTEAAINLIRKRGLDKLRRDEALMAQLRDLHRKLNEWLAIYYHFETFYQDLMTNE